MSSFRELRDENVIETALRGQALLETPLLNKGTAFTAAEREALGLLIAIAVAHQAQADGVAPETSVDQTRADIERRWWHPRYRQVRAVE